jgi:DNA-binding Lrp family transcriptional regulator
MNMGMSSKKQIKDDEKKLLMTLRKNSNDSIEQIAKRCGFSRQKFWRVKKRLEKNKTIWGYNTVFDDDKLGLKRYLILIKRTNKPLSPLQLKIISSRKIMQVTAKLGINVECSFFIHGSYDWFFSVTAKDIKHVKKVINIFTILLKDVISEVDVQEVIFPVEKNNFTNPNVNQIKDFFI